MQQPDRCYECGRKLVQSPRTGRMGCVRCRHHFATFATIETSRGKVDVRVWVGHPRAKAKTKKPS